MKRRTAKKRDDRTERRNPRAFKAGIVALSVVGFLIHGISAVFSVSDESEPDELEASLSLPVFATSSFEDLNRVFFRDALEAGEEEMAPRWTESDDSGDDVEAAPTAVRIFDHKVAKGQTAVSLSRKYGIKVGTLLSFNRLGSRTLKPGQKLRIPNRDGHLVTVRRGQSLWDIARAHRVSVPEIIAVNRIPDPQAVAPGTRLFLPGVEPPVAVASRARKPASAAPRPSSKIVWPLGNGRLTSGFGYRKHPITRRVLFHRGIDIAAPKGSSVRAIKGGRIVFSGRRGGYGLVVDIRHDDGAISRYAHNSAVTVKAGAKVGAGTVIAKVGSTGHSTGPHVHLEVIRRGERINPLKYLSRS